MLTQATTPIRLKNDDKDTYLRELFFKILTHAHQFVLPVNFYVFPEPHGSVTLGVPACTVTSRYI